MCFNLKFLLRLILLYISLSITILFFLHSSLYLTAHILVSRDKSSLEIFSLNKREFNLKSCKLNQMRVILELFPRCPQVNVHRKSFMFIFGTKGSRGKYTHQNQVSNLKQLFKKCESQLKYQRCVVQTLFLVLTMQEV